MKKSYTKYIVLATLFSSFVIGLSLSAKSIQANDDDIFNIKLDLYYATYGDYDNDGVKDDCYFEAKLFLGKIREAKSFWYLTIELPSGLTFEFTYSCEIDSLDRVVDVKIYTFNTAIESGWYIGTLYCGLYGFSDYICTYDQIIFDPPTGIGPGDINSVFKIS